eukprot:408213-Prorocentrum_minimum.AAC.1
MVTGAPLPPGMTAPPASPRASKLRYYFSPPTPDKRRRRCHRGRHSSGSSRLRPQFAAAPSSLRRSLRPPGNPAALSLNTLRPPPPPPRTPILPPRMTRPRLRLTPSPSPAYDYPPHSILLLPSVRSKRRSAGSIPRTSPVSSPSGGGKLPTTASRRGSPPGRRPRLCRQMCRQLADARAGHLEFEKLVHGAVETVRDVALEVPEGNPKRLTA